MTKTISHKLEVFQKRCLWRILRIYWPHTISNYELRRRKQEQNQLHNKSGEKTEMDCSYVAHATRRITKNYPLSDGLLITIGREADRKKHGRGQWRDRWRRPTGHGVTWNDEHPTETSGELWPRPSVFRDTKRIKHKPCFLKSCLRGLTWWNSCCFFTWCCSAFLCSYMRKKANLITKVNHVNISQPTWKDVIVNLEIQLQKTDDLK